MPIRRLHNSIISLAMVLTLSACGTLEVGVEPSAAVADRIARPTSTVTTPDAVTEESANPRQMTPTPVSVTGISTLEPAPTPVPIEMYSAPPSLRVVFLKGGDVWLWEAGSSNATPLTDDGEAKTGVTISDDGAMVAFRRGEQWWVIRADGTDERLVLSPEDLAAMRSEGYEVRLHQFEWVPGTHRLAFNTQVRLEGGDAPPADLRAVDVDTNELTVVLPTGQGGEFTYSPDGQQIAIATSGDISLVDADGRNRRDGILTYAPVAMPSGLYYIAKPSWTADGRSLLVAILPPNPDTRPLQHTTIWRIPADGQPAVLLTDVPAVPQEGMVVFSHQGDYVAYAEMPEALRSGALSSPIPQGSLKVMRLENGDWMGSPFPGLVYGWAPQSRRFAFSAEMGAGGSQLRIGQWSGPGFPSSVDAGVRVHDVLWVDADHYLFTVEGEGGGYDLRLADVDGASTILSTGLDFPDQLAYDVAVALTADSGVEPAAVSDATPTPAPLVSTAEGSEPSVVFLKNGDVWLWTENGSASTITLSGDVIDARISDDGRVVAYLKQVDERQAELWAVGYDGSDARRLVSVFDLFDMDSSALAVAISQLDWVPGTHTIAYSTREVTDGPGLMPYDDLRLVDADTLQQTTVLQPGEGGAFIYSPDGRRIVIATPEDISMMNADGSGRQRVLTYEPVVTMSEFRFYPRPVWAEDGRSLRVTIPPSNPFAEPAQPTTLWTIPADGSPAGVTATVDAQPTQHTVAFSPDLAYAAYLGEPDGTLMVTDLRSGGTVSYTVKAGMVYGWAPDSQRLAILAHEELPQARIIELDGEIVPVHDDASMAAIDFTWLDADRYLFLEQRGDGGWDLVLAQIGQPGTVLASVAGRPPAYDVAP